MFKERESENEKVQGQMLYFTSLKIFKAVCLSSFLFINPSQTFVHLHSTWTRQKHKFLRSILYTYVLITVKFPLASQWYISSPDGEWAGRAGHTDSKLLIIHSLSKDQPSMCHVTYDYWWMACVNVWEISFPSVSTTELNVNKWVNK